MKKLKILNLVNRLIISYKKRDMIDGWYGIRLVYGTGLSAAEGSVLPDVYSLNGIHPNPFNPRIFSPFSL